MNHVIYDEDGEWVVNEKSFPFVDDQGRRFDVGVKVKALRQGWVKAQVDAQVLKPADPPEAAAKPAPSPIAPKPVKAAVLPTPPTAA